ncbi:hypothetical protein [Bifidobacterium merycicum]|uniref:hypothetical protein n=1 Tax=Bifidobacterium merycicum TaxID=78345 RepID=UPI0015687DF9|nr:hypothetical protein [Bifidobacterium merycicum]
MKTGQMSGLGTFVAYTPERHPVVAHVVLPKDEKVFKLDCAFLMMRQHHCRREFASWRFVETGMLMRHGKAQQERHDNRRQQKTTENRAQQSSRT